MNFNKVIIGGNLTRDPENKGKGDTVVVAFSIAVNRKYKDKEEVTFIECVAFGKTGELVEKYFTKGKPILVEGRLKFDQWEDNGGNKRSKLSVVVEQVTFVGGKKSDDDGERSPRRPRDEYQPQPAGMASGDDDSCPF